MNPRPDRFDFDKGVQVGPGTHVVTAGPATWERLEEIAAEVGPSFYLADLGRFAANCERFLGAFRAVYPRTSIGYSYKTNYLPDFISLADSLGAYSEVVSRFEYDLAEGLGIPGERIILNGPIKRPDDLRRALGAGAIVNADSLVEVADVLAVAPDLDRAGRVGIRCYLGEQTPGSRFGIDVTAPEAVEAVGAIDAAPNVRLSGLHCHHSGDRSAAQYRDRARTMIRLHREMLGGRELDFIDMGGGFAGAMSPALARQLESSAATFEDYADAVAGEMRAAYGQHGPELILEPGMALLADAMEFATRVEVTKAQHRSIAVVDGSGLNVQPPWNLLRRTINLPITVVSAPGPSAADEGPWDVVGHTCIERDVLHEGHHGLIGVGDYVVFDNVGAYTNVLGAPFIRGTPPIVAADASRPAGEALRILRPISTARDLLRTYTAGTGGAERGNGGR